MKLQGVYDVAEIDIKDKPAPGFTRIVRVAGSLFRLESDGTLVGLGSGGISFNVRDYGAKGNNIADDWAAIMATVNASYADAQARGTAQYSIYMPQGRYQILQPLVVPFPIRIYGDGVSTSIAGDFADWLVKSNDGLFSASHGTVFCDLMFLNTRANGGCLQLPSGVTGATIDKCLFQGWNGIGQESPNGVFDVRILNSKFLGLANNTGNAIWLGIGGGYLDVGNDIQGWQTGRRLSGEGCAIHGGRMENNVTANAFGYGLANESLPFSSFDVSALELEANGISFDLNYVASGTIHDMGGATWAEDQGIYSGQYAFLIGTSQQLTLSNVTPAGIYHGATLRIKGATSSCTFINCVFENDGGTGRTYDLQCDPAGLRFVRTDYVPPSQTGVLKEVIPDAVGTRGVYRTDYLRGTVKSRNLTGQVIVPAAAGATSVNVTFAPACLGNAQGIGATASAGGSLASGTYHYAGTFITEQGESDIIGPSSVTLSGGNHTATALIAVISEPSDPTSYRFRIYRGSGASGDYDGYWDLGLKSAVGSPAYKQFVDDGTIAFTGSKNPSAVQATTGTAEPDASYNVVVTPKWDARVWITAQSTTGFTINFSSGPGIDTVVGWLLTR